MKKILILKGLFADQRGKVVRGKITGYNGNGVPCREYVWIEPELSGLKGKSFEAFDTQIEKAV